MPTEYFQPNIPSSKSASIRALILASLTPGKTHLHNISMADDSQALMDSLNSLNNLKISIQKNSAIVERKDAPLQTRNIALNPQGSQTAAKFLMVLATLCEGTTEIQANSQLKKRIIDGLSKTLEDLDVPVFFADQKYFFPMKIPQTKIVKSNWELSCSKSSQDLSALLLLMTQYLKLNPQIKVTGPLVSRPYVQLTMDYIQEFGLHVVEKNPGIFRIEPGNLTPQNLTIPHDATSLSYFVNLSLITKKEILLPYPHPTIRQGDEIYLELIVKMGANIIKKENGLLIQSQKLEGLTVDMQKYPDLVPSLAALAAFANSPTQIKNVGHLKFKESNRMEAIYQNFSKLGIQCKLTENDMIIFPMQNLPSTNFLDSYEDHRIVMSFAPFFLLSPLKFDNTSCVKKSFPTFWEEIKKFCDFHHLDTLLEK